MKQNQLLWLTVVAGAMLLAPSLAGAHSAIGPCVDCHIVHNSQDGEDVNAAGPQRYLLRLSCIGCHAYTTNLPATGRADGSSGPVAPQVGPQVAGGTQDSGGYFSNGGGAEDGRTHNVADLFGTAAGADSLMTVDVAPGGTFSSDDGSGAPVLRCDSCHDSTIGHAAADSARAGNATSSYRMLQRGGQYVAGKGSADFEADTGQNEYDAVSMNQFCAKCHGLFHGPAGTSSGGAWIRHPTEVQTNTYGPANYTGGDKVVPVGNIADGDYYVMCISCHRPHGSAYSDLLRFEYNGSVNRAGDVTASQGCETCHDVK